MRQVKPEEILKALENGPLTSRLLCMALGFRIADKLTWWQRLWKRRLVQEANRNGDFLADVLADMCRVGQIVQIQPAVWALPDRCPVCHGSGKGAGHPYRNGLQVVR